MSSQRASIERSEHFYYKNTIDAFKKMYKFEGLPVFYSGLIPSLFGLFHVAIHFPVYEKLKVLFHCNDHDQSKTSRLARLIMASSLSKMCASTLTYPHEILRTRMQIRSMSPTYKALKQTEKSAFFNWENWKKRGLISTILKIHQKEGWIGFYSGFTTNLARTVPASAVTLVSFEYISRYLSHHQK
jgi:solute carrier family 25 folate transporter 32